MAYIQSHIAILKPVICLTCLGDVTRDNTTPSRAASSCSKSIGNQKAALFNVISRTSALTKLNHSLFIHPCDGDTSRNKFHASYQLELSILRNSHNYQSDIDPNSISISNTYHSESNDTKYVN